MEVVEVLTLVGKILCLVIGGALAIGGGISLLMTGIDHDKQELSATRLKTEFVLTSVLPIVIALIPWEGIWSAIAPIAGLAVVVWHWAGKREDIARFKKNWGEMLVVRRVFCVGVSLLVLGSVASWLG